MAVRKGTLRSRAGLGKVSDDFLVRHAHIISHTADKGRDAHERFVQNDDGILLLYSHNKCSQAWFVFWPRRQKTTKFAAIFYCRNLRKALVLLRDRRTGGARSARKRSAMSLNSQNYDTSSDVAAAVEEADKEAARSAARHRHHPVVKTLGTASEIADQIPLSIVCAAMIGGGAIAGRPHITQAGLKMMTAHVLANSVKRIIKNNFKRTRPKVMIEEQTYECEAGESEGGHDTSFPSGHTAGAVAVATVMARDLPQTAVPALAIAAMIAGIQVPRDKHYPIDVTAGAVLGLAAACAVHAVWPQGHGPKRAGSENL